jgi:hypothetical protein
MVVGSFAVVSGSVLVMFSSFSVMFRSFVGHLYPLSWRNGRHRLRGRLRAVIQWDFRRHWVTA